MTKKQASKGGHWPWIIAGLLVFNALATGTLVALANSSSGHAVEPDYYARAVAWDDEMAQQERNRDLGWQLSSALEPTDDGALALRTTLQDREGAPVTGASIELVTFHRARAADRLTLALREQAPGVYRAAWRSPRRGAWELRYRVVRAGVVFTLREVAGVPP